MSKPLIHSAIVPMEIYPLTEHEILDELPHYPEQLASVLLGRPRIADLSESLELVDPLFALLKRMIDLAGATILAILLSPLLLSIAIATKFSSAGPILFVQPRVGRAGKLFNCYKFRTMIPDAELKLHTLLKENDAFRAEWEKAQKLRSDPRITRFGGLLRKTSLDELPQLINVLLGQMSLVGPRPVLPDQLASYGRSTKWYCAVRPGMTGLWQVKARGAPDFRRRVALDCYYVRRASVIMDFSILLRTFRVVVTGTGAY